MSHVARGWLSQKIANLSLLLKNSLVFLFHGWLFLGAAVIRAVVIRAVVIRGEANNAFHFAFQSGFDRLRFALASGNSAHVGRVEVELASDTPVKPAKQRCKVEGRYANAAFDFCHHPCYPFLHPRVTVWIDIHVTWMLYQNR
jgi:hypothetical protein